MASLKLNEVCLDLSARVSKLGAGINGRSAAQEYFSLLISACADIGGGCRAIECLPSPPMRIRQTEELIKLSQKVIFLLDSGLRQGLFPVEPAKSALSVAVKLAESLGKCVSEYCSKPVPMQPNVAMPFNAPMPFNVAMPVAGSPAPGQSAVNSDPDGFSEPADR